MKQYKENVGFSAFITFTSFEIPVVIGLIPVSIAFALKYENKSMMILPIVLFFSSIGISLVIGVGAWLLNMIFFKSSERINATIQGNELIIGKSIFEINRITKMSFNLHWSSRASRGESQRLILFFDNDERKKITIPNPSISLIRDLKKIATGTKLCLSKKDIKVRLIGIPIALLTAGIGIALFILLY